MQISLTKIYHSPEGASQKMFRKRKDLFIQLSKLEMSTTIGPAMMGLVTGGVQCKRWDKLKGKKLDKRQFNGKMEINWGGLWVDWYS